MNASQQSKWLAEQVVIMDQLMNQLVGINNPCHTHTQTIPLGNFAIQVPQIQTQEKEEKMSLEQEKQFYLADRLRGAVQKKKDAAKVTYGLIVDPDKVDETGYFKARKEILAAAQSVKDTVYIATPEEALKAIQAYEAS